MEYYIPHKYCQIKIVASRLMVYQLELWGNVHYFDTSKFDIFLLKIFFMQSWSTNQSIPEPEASQIHKNKNKSNESLMKKYIYK